MSKHPGPRSTPSATENGCVSSDPSGHTVSWWREQQHPGRAVAQPPAQVRAPVEDDQLGGGPEAARPTAATRSALRGDSRQDGRR